MIFELRNNTPPVASSSSSSLSSSSKIMDQLDSSESTLADEVSKIINTVTIDGDRFDGTQIDTNDGSLLDQRKQSPGGGDSQTLSGDDTTVSSSHFKPFLIVDDLCTAKILNQICPSQFNDQWLGQYQSKFKLSFGPRSPPVNQNDFVVLLVCEDSTMVPVEHRLYSTQARDRVMYQNNMEDILTMICQYKKVLCNTSLVSTTDGTDSPQEVERLLKDFRQYMDKCYELDESNANIDNAKCLLFESILIRLVKLLYDCVESNECRYEFYQIFSAIFEQLGSQTSSSNLLKNLHNVLNTLATFDMEFHNFGSFRTPPYSDSILWNKSISDCHNSKDVTGTSLSSTFDCEDIGVLTSNGANTGTNGGGAGSNSSAGNNSSGYGRCSSHSTASISSGPSSGVESLDSHPSPTPMYNTNRENFKSSHSTLLHSSLLLMDSTDSTNQLKSVIADALDESVSNLSLRPNLSELNDLPNLISPNQVKLTSNDQLSFDFNSLSIGGTGGDVFESSNKSNNVGEFYQTSDDGFNLPPLFSSVDLTSTNTDQMYSKVTGSSGLLKNHATISANDSIAPSSVPLPNQCYTITMDSNVEKNNNLSTLQQFLSSDGYMMDGQKSRSNIPNQQFSFTDPSSVYSTVQSQTINNHSSTNQHSTNIDHESSIAHCDRVLLYRFIISQLLFDGHRSIANQLTIAERIKADGSLLSPNDRLHTLVSIAIRKEIDRLSVDNNITPGSTNQNTPPFNTSNYNSMLGGKHFNQQSRLLEDNSYSKSMDQINVDPSKSAEYYERAASHIGYSLNPNQALFNGTNNSHNNASMDYSDMSMDNISDTYEMFYSGRASGISQNSSLLQKATNEIQQTSQMQRSISNGARQLTGPTKNISPLSSIVMELNNSSNSDSSFVLTEDGLKNLNQLAKLNAADSAQSNSNQSMLTNNTPYNRSVSSLAMANLNSPHMSRSPVPLMANSGRKTPISSCYPINTGHNVTNSKSHQIMQIRYKFGNLGSQTNQFSSPHGFCLGLNDEIIIADTNNHRICIYEKTGAFKTLFGVSGKDEGQLWYPRKITMISNNNIRGSSQNFYYVICDRGMERSRMQIFSRTGTFVRKIPIRYIDIVAGIAVNTAGQIVAVDSVSPTIYIITETGNLHEWYDCSNYMREPSDIAIYENDYYICDFKGHCVVVMSSTGKYLRKIGMEGLTSFPNGIDISPTGDIYVGDSHGNRFHVVIFNQQGKLISEYECPYVKVSRCCGLKLTRDNCIVTLAKNNHHVLVLNLDYPQLNY